jgi:hypothetical protein
VSSFSLLQGTFDTLASIVLGVQLADELFDVLGELFLSTSMLFDLLKCLLMLIV